MFENAGFFGGAVDIKVPDEALKSRKDNKQGEPVRYIDFIFEFVQKGSNQGCPWVENPGEGVDQIFAKIPRGRVLLSGQKLYCTFINNNFEICLWGQCLPYPLSHSPPSPLTPLCASMDNLPPIHPNMNFFLSRTPCFPLYSILLALGNPKVDYFSLDIEGAG
jgi:hypothetical protein